MRRLVSAMIAAAAIGVFAAPTAVRAQGVDGDVDVAALVITDVTSPSGVVPGNSLQTVTVTVRNDLPQALSAVRVALDGVDNSGPQTVTIAATSTRTVTFSAVPCRSGASTLTATVTATDGSATLTDASGPVTLQVAAGSTCTTTVNTPGGTLSITTNAGRVANLTSVPLAGLPAPPAGVNLPYGAISFTIEDLTPGAAVTVRITVPGPATSYAKLTAGGWVLVPGAVTIGNGVAVTLTDGGIGDADGLANGRIVDPGAVVGPTPQAPTDTTSPSTTATSPPTTPDGAATPTTAPARPSVGPGAGPATTVPAPFPAAGPGGSPGAPAGASPTDRLPRTGSDGLSVVWVGLAVTALGVVLLVARRRLSPR